MMNHIVTGGFSSIEQATGKFGGKRSLTNNTGQPQHLLLVKYYSRKKVLKQR